MRRKRVQRTRSIPDLLREFFANNRDEWLTPQDIADKYDIALATAHVAMRILVQEGAIKVDTIAYVHKSSTLTK